MWSLRLGWPTRTNSHSGNVPQRHRRPFDVSLTFELMSEGAGAFRLRKKPPNEPGLQPRSARLARVSALASNKMSPKKTHYKTN